MVWTERIFSLFLLLIGIIFFLTSFQYEMLADSGGIGSAFLPRVLSGILICLSLFYFWNVLKQKKVIKSDRVVHRQIIKQQFIFIAALFLGLFFVKILGLLVTWGLFLIGGLYYFERTSWKKSIVFSVVAMVCLYFIFVQWLKVSFPTGIFFSNV